MHYFTATRMNYGLTDNLLLRSLSQPLARQLGPCRTIGRGEDAFFRSVVRRKGGEVKRREDATVRGFQGRDGVCRSVTRVAEQREK